MPAENRRDGVARQHALAGQPPARLQDGDGAARRGRVGADEVPVDEIGDAPRQDGGSPVRVRRAREDLQGAEAVRHVRPQEAQPRPVEDARVRGGAHDVEHAAVGTVVDEERPVGTSGRLAVAPGREDEPEVGEAVDRTPGERGDQGRGRLVDDRRGAGVLLGEARVEFHDRRVVQAPPDARPPAGVVRPPQEREPLVRRRQAASIPRADRKDVEVVEVRPADDAVEHVVGGERIVTALEHVVDGQVRQAPHRRVRARPCRAPPTQDSNDDHRRHERGAGDVHGAAAARRQHGLVQRLWQLNKRGISHNEVPTLLVKDGNGSTLHCFLEQLIPINGTDYGLLTPVDTPVSLFKLVDDGDYEAALELGHNLEKEKKYQYDEQLLFIIGSIYYILGDADKSLEYLDKSLEISSNDTEALMLKANVHIHLKEKNIAIDCCRKILEIDEENWKVKDLLSDLENSD